MKIWLDNRICESTEIEMDGDGWPIGEGIFETIRTEAGKVFELGRHMRRAGSAAKNFGQSLPGEELIRNAIVQLLDAQPHEVGRLRLLFSKDRFVAVHQSYVEIVMPARLKIADEGNEISPIAFKTFPYGHRTSLLEQARSEGFDEIICVSQTGEVTEGAVSNFIFLIDGQWVTTPLSAGVLPGVQRAIVIERCGVVVRSLSRTDLDRITSAIVISSLKIALLATSINDRELVIDEGVQLMAAQIRTQTQSHSVG
jgi:branched-chain amino acid aminotransferase